MSSEIPPEREFETKVHFDIQKGAIDYIFRAFHPAEIGNDAAATLTLTFMLAEVLGALNALSNDGETEDKAQ